MQPKLDVSRTVDDPDEPAEGDRRTRAAPQLYVALEGHQPRARTWRIDLGGTDEIVIGRADRRVAERSGRSLRLGFASPSMSSRHARLVREGDGFVLEDLQAKNGTFVGARRVDRHVLADGDVFDAGRVFMLVDFDGAVPAHAPLDVDGTTTMQQPVGLRSLLPDLERAHARLASVAQTTLPVLLLGPSGSGKELVARGVHVQSGRPGAFVGVNCGALPVSMVEAMLFGHVKGAFSGAARDEPGLVRASHGGTLFLDEIGDLRPESQAALLRVIEEREVLAVGATRPVGVDLRIVAATHRPLEDLAAEGSFRPDLLARLRGYVHRLPTLRERRADLGLIIADILDALAPEREVSFSPKGARALLRHPFPLNARELRQALAAALALSTGGVLDEESLALTATASSAPDETETTPTAAPTREQLVELLQVHEGNVAAVGRAIGKAPKQVRRWMERHGLDPNAFRP